MNPTMFSIGSIEIKWYSVCILLGVGFGYYIFQKEAKKYNYKSDFIFNLFFWSIVAAFIGARIYYIVFNWSLYQDDPFSIFKIWEGGLAIHGGLIFGFLAMALYCKKYHVRLFKIVDMATIPVLLGQAIGRWGNFFNGEAHGFEVALTELQKLHLPTFIIEGMYIRGHYYHPTFFYESMWCLLGIILLIILKRYKYLKVGQLTCVYLMWYGFGRFFIESMRTDSLMLGAFKVAQIVSVVLFIIGLFTFMILSRKGKFEDLYQEENHEEIKF